ncbi:hypothetical protein L9F63_008482, partial [Diploptera punctata]
SFFRAKYLKNKKQTETNIYHFSRIILDHKHMQLLKVSYVQAQITPSNYGMKNKVPNMQLLKVSYFHAQI